jgi:hypothetical protein
MLTSAAEVKNWLKLQEDVVVCVSAYLAPIKAYAAKCRADIEYADDINGVYQLHTLVQNIDLNYLHQSLSKLNLQSFYQPLVQPYHYLVSEVTNQTIPSVRKAGDDFVRLVETRTAAISEIVIALAKMPPPPFSVTLAARVPFDAYLLLSRIIESATDFVFIADAYMDASLFDRYLYRVNDGVRVSLRTNPSNWNKKGWREQFEQAEALFSVQHPQYERVDRADLHARYLITETGGWRIDGSIKDAAVAKDCPIHTITPEEREKVVADLFSTEKA